MPIRLAQGGSRESRSRVSWGPKRDRVKYLQAPPCPLSVGGTGRVRRAYHLHIIAQPFVARSTTCVLHGSGAPDGGKRIPLRELDGSAFPAFERRFRVGPRAAHGRMSSRMDFCVRTVYYRGRTAVTFRYAPGAGRRPECRPRATTVRRYLYAKWDLRNSAALSVGWSATRRKNT